MKKYLIYSIGFLLFFSSFLPATIFAQTNEVTPTLAPTGTPVIGSYTGNCDPTKDENCYQFLEALPTSEGDLTSVNTGVTGQEGKGLGGFIMFAFEIGVGIAGVLGVVMLTIYGFQYAANDKNIATFEVLKERITKVMLGLLLLLGIFVILNTINPDLLIVEPSIEVQKLSIEDQLAVLSSGIKIPKDTKITPTQLKEAKAIYVSASNAMETIYKPALERAVPNAEKGIKTLMMAQTQFEGFIPPKPGSPQGSLSYRTNNPGNIGNVDGGGTKKFSTLEEGIKRQYEYYKAVALNLTTDSQAKSNYKIGRVVKINASYDSVTRMTYPGIDFVYNGSISQYLKIYATGARLNNNYLSFIMGYFKKEKLTITPTTTIAQIYNIK